MDAANPAAAVKLDMERYRDYFRSVGMTDEQINQRLDELVKMRTGR